MTSLLIALLTGFFGTLGFCVILQVPRKAMLPAAAVGGMAWLLCCVLMQLGL